MLYLYKEPNMDIKNKSFLYQQEIIDSISKLEYVALFLEQGLGKTKIAIDLLIRWLINKEIDTVLIVCKKSLVPNWLNEFDIHTYIKPKIFDQNKRNNYYVFNSPSRVIITHFEVINSEYERFGLFLKARDIGIIIDESAKIKNPNSKVTKCIFKLSSLFKKRVIMSGTPISNRPYDIWAQIWFLDHGKSLGNDYKDFKKNYDLKNEFVQDIETKEIFESNINKLSSLIKDFTVRLTKDNAEINLPNKIIKNISTSWEKKQMDLYNDYQREFNAIIFKNGKLQNDNAEQILKRLSRLIQISSNPCIVDDSYKNTPGKFVYLEDIVIDIINNKEKCIIWTSYIKNLNWLYKRLLNYGVCKLSGKMTIKDRYISINKFIHNDEIKILIATPGAGKEGLTLTVANHVIFFDRTYSLDDYLQAQDRIHRISQDRVCTIYNLIMKNSIDEWINVLLESKHLAAQLSQGDIDINEYKSKINYNFGEIIYKILNN